MKLVLTEREGEKVFMLTNMEEKEYNTVISLTKHFRNRGFFVVTLKSRDGKPITDRVILKVRDFDVSKIVDYVQTIRDILESAGLKLGEIEVEGLPKEEIKKIIEGRAETEEAKAEIKVEEESSREAEESAADSEVAVEEHSREVREEEAEREERKEKIESSRGRRRRSEVETYREIVRKCIVEVKKKLGASLLELCDRVGLCSIPRSVYALFGVASVGKTRTCIRLAYELMHAGFEPKFIVAESNWEFGEYPLTDLVQDLFGKECILYARDIKELVANVLTRLNTLPSDSRYFIVFDSFGAIAHAVGEQILQKEIERALEAQRIGEEVDVKLEPVQISARAIPILNIVTRFLSNIATRYDSIVICIAHESQTVMRKWHGYTVKPSFGERSLHYMLAVYRLTRTEEGNRRLTCIVNREKPELEGRSVNIPRDMLDLERLVK